jgi:hypothetical protein
MDSSAEGERYARIFRKAGVYLARGNVARALEVLKEETRLAVLFLAWMERVKAARRRAA